MAGVIDVAAPPNPRCHGDCRCQKGHVQEDVSWVLPDLAVGGMPHDWDIPRLQELGVTHVLSVNWPDRPEYPEVVAAFAHLDLAILDDAEPKPPEWFRAGIAFAESVPPEGKLLVHCGHGINRSPAMVYAILLSRGVKDPEAKLRTARHQTGTSTFAIYRDSAHAALGLT